MPSIYSVPSMGEMRMHFPFKRDEVLHAALAAGHGNPNYQFIYYEKLAGVINFNSTKNAMKGGFGIYVTCIEYDKEITETSIRVVEIDGIVATDKDYQKHIDYMIRNISNNLKLIKNK